MWEWENWIDWIGSPDFFFLICNFSQETSFCLVLHWPFKVNLNSNVWFLKANNCTRLLVRPTKHKQTFMKQLRTLMEEKKEGTHQSNIQELIIIPDIREGRGDVGVEVIPPQTKLFSRHFVRHAPHYSYTQYLK